MPRVENITKKGVKPNNNEISYIFPFPLVSSLIWKFISFKKYFINTIKYGEKSLQNLGVTLRDQLP